jgi:hypothetical protein
LTTLSVVSGFPPVRAPTRLASTGGFGAAAGGAVAAGDVGVLLAATGAGVDVADGAEADGIGAEAAGSGLAPPQAADASATVTTTTDGKNVRFMLSLLHIG